MKKVKEVLAKLLSTEELENVLAISSDKKDKDNCIFKETNDYLYKTKGVNKEWYTWYIVMTKKRFWRKSLRVPKL
jgi:hypothetical protein